MIDVVLLFDKRFVSTDDLLCKYKFKRCRGPMWVFSESATFSAVDSALASNYPQTNLDFNFRED